MLYSRQIAFIFVITPINYSAISPATCQIRCDFKNVISEYIWLLGLQTSRQNDMVRTFVLHGNFSDTIAIKGKLKTIHHSKVFIVIQKQDDFWNSRNRDKENNE